MKRNILGALLMLAVVGEPTVGFASGLFSPVGFVVLGALYFISFVFYDRLLIRYNISFIQLLAINFLIYSVFITGLLHGELSDYVNHPENNLITTLIRLQAAWFPLFVFPLLSKIAPHQHASIKPLWPPILWFIGYVLLLTPTNTFGLVTFINTVKTVPAVVAGYLIIGGLFLLWSYRRPVRKNKRDTTLVAIGIVLALVGSIPNIVMFLVLIALTLSIGPWVLINKQRYQQRAG